MVNHNQNRTMYTYTTSAAIEHLGCYRVKTKVRKTIDEEERFSFYLQHKSIKQCRYIKLNLKKYYLFPAASILATIMLKYVHQI